MPVRNTLGFQTRPSAPVKDDLGLTPEQKTALMQSIAKGRAQVEAGDGIPGEEMSRWLRSWGSENELPPPPARRRA